MVYQFSIAACISLQPLLTNIPGLEWHGPGCAVLKGFKVRPFVDVVPIDVILD
ncbi:hypothetical protein HMPREF9710_00791 [Massilia timonae CCUG 45783]|uniref:Uncharacterized protein n=1 Tax=Massilia timonae CCUG 45783 TaxID=883126 RepID=K9DIN5_9BURK|nr:hypothetical protein HMPREF9710_00791 [Massilia timonae CCUG 45783]